MTVWGQSARKTSERDISVTSICELKSLRPMYDEAMRVEISLFEGQSLFISQRCFRAWVPANPYLRQGCPIMWLVGTVTAIKFLKGSGGNAQAQLLLTSISPDERDLLVDSPLYSAVNTRRTTLQDECAYKCGDWLFALLQLAPVHPQVRIRRKKTKSTARWYPSRHGRSQRAVGSDAVNCASELVSNNARLTI